MLNLAGLIAGLVAGVIGAGAWAGLAYAAHIEIGWLAWGVGALVGYAVFKFGGVGGSAPGSLAVVVAVLSIVAGKYAFVQMQLHSSKDGQEFCTAIVAEMVLKDYRHEGRKVSWPGGREVSPENRNSEADYPPDVWRQAQTRWKEARPEAREALLAVVQDRARDSFDRGGWFKAMFSPMDAVFIALAVATAYKLGSTGRRGRQKQPEVNVAQARRRTDRPKARRTT